MAFSSKKYFRNFGGQDLRSPELLRDDTTATDTLNVSFSENLSLTKRRGFQHLGRNVGGAGSATFNEVDIATGIQSESRLVFDSGVHQIKNDAITLNYSGSLNPSVEIKVEDAVFKLFLYEDGEVQQKVTLGNAKNISETDIDSTLAAISGDFSFTGTANSPNVLAANLKAVPLTSFEGSIDLAFEYYEEVDYPTGISNPLQAHWDTRNSPDFEINSTVQTNDVIYVTNGKTGLFKYDALRFYKAGLPKPAGITSSLGTSGSIVNGDYIYRIVYKHTDNKENVIFSTPSDESIITVSSNETIDLTVPNIEHGSGYDTDGDIEILILRSNPNGSVLYVLDTVTNDPTSATQVYNDSNSDELTEDYRLPPFELNIVPSDDFKCRYVDIWRGQIVLTGDEQDVNKTYYSDIEYPEGFSESNTFLTSTRLGGPNTGIRSLDNYLFVFKANSITAVTGDLATSQFQVDTLSDEGIGCLAHASLMEARSKVWFLGRRGIYSVDRNGVTLESAPLTPIFTEEFDKIATLRAVSFNWINEEMLLFLLPETEIVSGEVRVKPESRTLAYNTQVGVWTTFNNLDFSCGINIDVEDVWFSGSYINSVGNVVKCTSEILRTFTEIDYADHTDPIEWVYKSNWETLGEPSVFKKFVRLKLYSLDTPLQGFETTAFTMGVETNHDYVDEIVSKTDLPFKEPNTGWGTFPWGTARWGEVKPVTRRTRLRPQKARSLRTVLKNSVTYENVLLSGYEFEVALEHAFTMRRR